jgi:oligopeptide transport system substrate-binding protein
MFPSPAPGHHAAVRLLLVIAALVLAAGMAAPWLVLPGRPRGPVVATRAPATIDPLQASRLEELRLLDALFEPLVRLDQGQQPVPALALGWTCAGDGLAWSFRLDPAARWHDGGPVTAAQAAAGISRHLGGRSPLAMLLAPVRAVEPGAGELTVRLHHPAPWLPTVLALPVFAPAHPAQERWADPAAVVGNGPLRVAGWLARHHYDLEPAPGYAGPHRAAGPVRLLCIDSADTAVRLYLGGMVDVVAALPADAIRDLRRHQVPGLLQSPALGTELYRLRCSGGGPLADARVRRALDLACAREDAVRLLLHGEADPAWSLLPPALGGATAAAVADPEALLRAAEADLGPRAGWPALELWVPSAAPERVRVAEHLVDAWRRRLGLDLRLRTAPATEVRAREDARTYDLCRGSLTADYLDPLTFLEAFRSAAGGNRTGWSDPAYDALLDRVQGAAPAARAGLLQDAAERLAAQAPFIPLWHYRCTMLVRPGIEGVAPTPLETVALQRIRRQ